eukprot:TRINITY_DN10995_c0_g1_i3.p1 TRINITY_DN10995_c0_g1~~TRINITY_DN10995_c0_g1_i3.p1  ORF type:complete len:422 (+),score=22.90 TRINITY_DN10995_c0_g1_i3:279-1544(+)
MRNTWAAILLTGIVLLCCQQPVFSEALDIDVWAEYDLLQVLYNTNFSFVINNDSATSPSPSLALSPTPTVEDSAQQTLSVAENGQKVEVETSPCEEILTSDELQQVSHSEGLRQQEVTDGIPQQEVCAQNFSSNSNATLPLLQRYSDFIQESVLSSRQPTLPLPTSSSSIPRGIQYQDFEALALEQSRCSTNIEETQRTRYSAVGIIRIKTAFQDVVTKYCMGTLVSRQLVMTVASCVMQSQEMEVVYEFQYVLESNWRKIPQNSVFYSNVSHDGTYRESKFVIMKLEEEVADSITMDYQISQTQTRRCFVTIMGQASSPCPTKDFRLISCPELPDVRNQLGITGDNCGALCNLNTMDLLEGSSILMVCDPSAQQSIFEVTYSLIGLLQNEGQGSGEIVPYMFSSEIYNQLKLMIQNAQGI